jgi:hypothetical protein
MLKSVSTTCLLAAGIPRFNLIHLLFQCLLEWPSLILLTFYQFLEVLAKFTHPILWGIQLMFFACLIAHLVVVLSPMNKYMSDSSFFRASMILFFLFLWIPMDLEGHSWHHWILLVVHWVWILLVPGCLLFVFPEKHVQSSG